MSEPSLHPLKPAVAGVQALLAGQLHTIAQCLAHYPMTDREIHEVRKEVKRARSTLRLLRPSVGERRFRLDNIALRDIARPLGQVRDARVLLDALENLCKHAGKAAGVIPRESIHRLLSTELAAATAGHSPSSRSTAKAQKTLKEMARRYAVRTKEDEPECVIEGLRKVYRAGRKRMSTAHSSRTAHDLHEWRKVTKYLWHQLEILGPFKPQKLGALTQDAKRLSGHLGDEHDLAVLRDKLELNSSLFANVRQKHQTLDLIDERESKLQVNTFAIGDKLYHRRSKEFAKNLLAAWSLLRHRASKRTSEGSRKVPPAGRVSKGRRAQVRRLQTPAS